MSIILVFYTVSCELNSIKSKHWQSRQRIVPMAIHSRFIELNTWWRIQFPMKRWKPFDIVAAAFFLSFSPFLFCVFFFISIFFSYQHGQLARINGFYSKLHSMFNMLTKLDKNLISTMNYFFFPAEKKTKVNYVYRWSFCAVCMV